LQKLSLSPESNSSLILYP